MGGWQGTAALRVSFDGTETLDEALVLSLRCALLEGVKTIWVESTLWGTDEWDNFVRLMKVDPLLEDLPIVVIRDITAEHWGIHELDWIMDLTDLFNRTMSRDALHRTIASLQIAQRPAEILWREPNPENLSPQILDLISETLNPAMFAFIICSEEREQIAFSAVSRATSRWSLRRRIGA